MKFIVSSESLLKELQILGGIINNTNTLPILDNFLFHLNEDQLILTASDLETTMEDVNETIEAFSNIRKKLENGTYKSISKALISASK